MKVAISVTKPKRDASLDQRFGRAAAFVTVDTTTGEYQVYPNPAVGASGGAGIQAAEFLAKKGVETVISGAFGPKAHDALRAANVEMYRAKSGTVTEIVEKFQQNDLRRVK